MHLMSAVYAIEPFDVWRIKPLTPGIEWSTGRGSTSIESIEKRGEWDSNPRVLSDMGLAIPRPARLGDPRPLITFRLCQFILLRAGKFCCSGMKAAYFRYCHKSMASCSTTNTVCIHQENRSV